MRTFSSSFTFALVVALVLTLLTFALLYTVFGVR